MPGRAWGPDLPDTASHAAELAFYLRGCPLLNWQAPVSTRKTRPAIMERAVEGKDVRMAIAN